MEDGSAIPGTVGVDFAVPSQADINYYHSKNLNTIRLPFLWERMEPPVQTGVSPLVPSGSLSSTYLSYVQAILGYAAANGMKVVIDCHNYGAYGGNLIGSANGPTQAQFATFWNLLATALAGNPGLGGYDIMNEPAGFSGTVWPNAAQAAITAIRTADTIAPIYVEGNGYSSAFQWAANGNSVLASLTDPNNNLVFEAHAYGDYNNSGTYPVYPQSVAVSAGCLSGQTTYQCAQIMGDQLTSPASALDTGVFIKRYTPFVTAFCQAYSVKCLIGESGVSNDDANWLTALSRGITYLQSNGIQVLYWNAGPYSAGYFLGVEPANGVDTVQMAVLTKFTNAYQPTSYYLSGPQRGTGGVASSNFSLNYYGYISSPIVFTLTDGGAGGTFTPSTVTCAAGFNCTQVFTYTAPGTSVYAISATNSAGLVNPSPLGYATASDLFSSNSISPSNIVNIFSLRKIYAPYIGNVLTLRRASDNATQNFGFNGLGLNSLVNTAAVQAWNGTSEFDTLASTTVIVQYALSFSSDSGVYYWPSGTPLALTPNLPPPLATPPPSAGHYEIISPGHYLFNSADVGNTVKITYQFPTYVVTAYDQSPNGYNLTPIVADGGQSPSVADQPNFYIHCNSSYPCINFSGANRMDMVSPITGGTQQTILSVFTPQFHWGNGNFFGWDWSGTSNYDFAPPGSNTAVDDRMNYTGSAYGGGVREYTNDSTLNAIGATYSAGLTDGIYTYMNGALVSKGLSASGTLSLPYGRNNATFGYQRFSPASWVGSLSEHIVLNTAESGAIVQAFHSDEDTFWGIPTFSGYTYYSPTLAQSASIANPPPWAGFNQTGCCGQFGIGTNFTVPQAGLNYFASRGFNIARVPISWENLQPNLCAGNTTLSAAALAQLDSYVANINTSAADALIDLHNFGGYNYSAVSACASPPDNGSINQTTTGGYFVNLWTQLAAHYASNPKVMFDLMNEPASISATQMATIGQSAITAIRGQSFTGYIFWEPGSSYAACNQISSTGGPAFITLTDSSNKLILECHAYLNSNGPPAYSNNCGNDQCGDSAYQGAALANLQSATSYCSAHGCHLFWGEFNAGFTPQMYSEMSVAFNLMASNPSVWYGWTEYQAGAANSEGYPGLLTPGDFNFPIADRPQMRILNAYATGHTWPTATGAWPYNVQFP